MHALKVRVENGRIKLDEPTDLPNGTELYIVSAKQIEDVLGHDEGFDDDEDLDDEERAALNRELEASVAEAEAGELVDFDVALAELRSRS